MMTPVPSMRWLEGDREMTSEVSKLALLIEAKLKDHPNIRLYGPQRLYLQGYITAAGFVFAAERRGDEAVILWLPPDIRARRIADEMGLVAEVSEPYPDPQGPHAYGRLSSIEQMPEIAFLTLLRVEVTSPSDALKVLDPILRR